ncbi:MAG: CopG family transcriptional regulator [Peptoclostridium sp.]|uniref:CopG family transcriptional regulator n=1 Tax=Peptoclostridium sp. TaxID=1904860 RepID=UPI00139E03B2|nr:CopG family transcriptional regulator [Peptoclostridium sp.]MZQ75933.1 CopG family transcriptional regulator [Peptoclostridium sp.]
MSDSTQKITLDLPCNLVEEINKTMRADMKDISEFFREAAKMYLLKQRQRDQIRSEMISGYCEMASINLALAEMGFARDMSSLVTYERKMAKSE